jgi:transglutaminase-like putative cysteine protease
MEIATFRRKSLPPVSMSILVALSHRTRYDYDRPVRLGPQIVRLRPAPYGRTHIASYALAATPAQHSLNWQHDPHGNWLARFVFPEKTMELSLAVELTAELTAINPFDFLVEPFAETWPFDFPPELRSDLSPFLAAETAGPRLAEFLQTIPRKATGTVELLADINKRLCRLIRYVTRPEGAVLPVEDTLAAGAGSCRDTAWLMVQILRHCGLPARFVSGYLIQLRSENTSGSEADAAAQDHGALHAWAEVYLPGAGWIGFDSTSGLLCGEGHLPLAATPHYSSAAPVTGTVEPCDVTLSYDINVRRIGAGTGGQ